MFSAGTANERDSGEQHRIRTDAAGYSWKDRTSIDAMLFPMLHPGGMGAFRRGESLSAMLEQRMQQLFSGFTLLPEYVLVMFQVRETANPSWSWFAGVAAIACASWQHACMRGNCINAC